MGDCRLNLCMNKEGSVADKPHQNASCAGSKSCSCFPPSSNFFLRPTCSQFFSSILFASFPYLFSFFFLGDLSAAISRSQITMLLLLWVLSTCILKYILGSFLPAFFNSWRRLKTSFCWSKSLVSSSYQHCSWLPFEATISILPFFILCWKAGLVFGSQCWRVLILL